jgi:hypothetical protein
MYVSIIGNAALLFPAVMTRQTRGMDWRGRDYKGEELEMERLERKGVKKEFVVTNLRSKTFRFHSVICSCIIDQ